MEQIIYFTIKSYSTAGFTDQLAHFNAFYKLGKYLNYTYLHNEFNSIRSNPIDPSNYEKIRFLINRIILRFPVINKFINYIPLLKSTLIYNLNIFDYIGFNNYYNKIPPNISFNEIEIKLSDEVIKNNNISDIHSLILYVKKSIDIVPSQETNNLVVFSLIGTWSFFSLIHTNLPKPKDLFALKDNKRYRRDKIKILLHIRLGDTCILETPWNTFIPVDDRLPDFLFEYVGRNEIDFGNLLEPKEYLDIVSFLNQTFLGKRVEFICFSDGYKRAFKILYKNYKRLKISTEKEQILKRAEKKYDKIFIRNIYSNFKMDFYIGEKNKYLQKFIAASIRCDIIITHAYQTMLPKLISTLTDSAYPLLIVVFKNEKPNYNFLPNEFGTRVFFLDANEPDYYGLNNFILNKIGGIRC